MAPKAMADKKVRAIAAPFAAMGPLTNAPTDHWPNARDGGRSPDLVSAA
jgi:hypothetical protein